MSLSSLEFIFHIFFIFRQNISFLEPLHHFCSDQMRPTHHSLVRICPVLMLSSLLTSRCLSPPSFSNTPLPPQLQTASHADLSVSHAPATPLCSAWVIHPDPLLSAQMPLPSDLPVPLDSRTHPERRIRVPTCGFGQVFAQCLSTLYAFSPERAGIMGCFSCL